MAAANTAFRAKVGSSGLVETASSLLLGTGFTLCLFLGVARFLRTESPPPPSEIDDLHAISLPLQPPPPPRVNDVEKVATEEEPSFLGFEAAPSDSPVKIAISPPTFESILPSDQIPPQAMIRIGRLEGVFKPKMDLTLDTDHVFQQSEVDQMPAVLYRDDPVMPSTIRANGKTLRVLLVFVVDAHGEVGNVRLIHSSGNPQFDSIIVASVKDWTFSPAIKKGKQVKCLIQQSVTVRMEKASPF